MQYKSSACRRISLDFTIHSAHLSTLKDESEDIMVPGGGDENDTIIIMRSGCIMRVSFAGSADVSDDDSFLRFALKGNIPFLDERDICRLILKQRQS